MEFISCIRNFPKHCKTAFQNIWRNGVMSVSSIFAVTITLLLINRKGERTFPKKSCSLCPSKFPDLKKFFTKRSSKEWYVITTNRPPGLSTCKEDWSISRSAVISSLTSILKAWNACAKNFFSLSLLLVKGFKTTRKYWSNQKSKT